MLKRETHCGSKVISGTFVPLKRPRFWSDDILPFADLINPLPLLLSVFVVLFQTAVSNPEHNALKIFQVTLRRPCYLLHVNVLYPILEDKHKISVCLRSLAIYCLVHHTHLLPSLSV